MELDLGNIPLASEILKLSFKKYVFTEKNFLKFLKCESKMSPEVDNSAKRLQALTLIPNQPLEKCYKIYIDLAYLELKAGNPLIVNYV
jgi:hypothetical protein